MMIYEAFLVILLSALLQLYFLELPEFIFLLSFGVGNSIFVRTFMINKFEIPCCVVEKTDINEINLKIKKLKDGTDYLHEYIDSL